MPIPKIVHQTWKTYDLPESTMKQIEIIKCEICDSEATRFLDNVNEIGEVCDSCYCEVGI